MWTGLRSRFHKADLQESSRQLDNPGCGWYHIYPFEAQKEPDPVDICEEEQLALVLIDIGAFRTCSLSDPALSYIEQILDFFHRSGKQMILRFTYDTAGKGMEREPCSAALIKKHMEQLGSMLCSHAEDILTLQGLFVGSWGEMHGSRYLTDHHMAGLADTLYRAAQGRCYLAVRTPVQWRKITRSRIVDPGLQKRLGLFNDGIFGSSTDLGTYGTAARQEAEETHSWRREDELAWQSLHMESAPNGGEALAGESLTGYLQAAKDLQRMHVSYLSSVWQQEQLDHWRAETVEQPGCWGGLSGYEYIGRHLGYRFVVRDVRLLPGGYLQIAVENCGFAGLCEEADCFLLIRQDAAQKLQECLDTDVCSWKSKQRTLLRVALPQSRMQAGKSRLFLQLKRKRDGRPLRFANQGADEEVFLGVYTMRA